MHKQINRVAYRAALAALLPFLTFAITLCYGQTMPSRGPERTWALRDGQFFTGAGFERTTWYVVEGRFTRRRPAQVDTTVELAGVYVVPPYGDAHTHNLDGAWGLERIARAYSDEGTFYIQVLGDPPREARQAQQLLQRAGVLDVRYAHSCLTSEMGHPFAVYEPLAMGIYGYPNYLKSIARVRKSRIRYGNSYFFVNNADSLRSIWPRYLRQRPDVCKLMLLDHTRYAEGLDTVELGDNGLSAEMARAVADSARRAGLPTWAHLETAADFRLATELKITGAAHMPGYAWAADPSKDCGTYLATLADLRAAAKAKLVMTPTLAIGVNYVRQYSADGKESLDSTRYRTLVDYQKRFVRDCRAVGLSLLVGSDSYGSTAWNEVKHWHSLGVLQVTELLSIWSVATPQAIHPGRRIGRFAEGFEASFLVLDGDPRADLGALQKIRLRVKQGAVVR